MSELGFGKTATTTSGQPSYNPSQLLKLYLYGYMNRIRSNSRLEREGQRNVEVMWLLHGLRPCYKSIADFRKNNAKCLKAVHKAFIGICRSLSLLGGVRVAIDGTYMRGNVSKASVAMEKRREEARNLDSQIEAYYKELEENDKREDKQAENFVEGGHISKSPLAELESLLEQKRRNKESREASQTGSAVG